MVTAVVPYVPAPIVGSITANGGVVGASVIQETNLVLMCSGTFNGVNCVFEASLDATTSANGTWFGIQAVRTNANTIETTTGVLSAPPAYAWELSVNGYSRFRIRATAWVSGTQVWNIQACTFATEPIPAAQVSATQPVSFTQAALPAGTAAMGDVGVQYRANATGAGTVTNVNCPATAIGQAIKGSAGRLLAFRLVNTNAQPRWLKIFNATAVTPGTTSALTEIALPTNQPVLFSMEGGMAFVTGIMFMVTSAQGLTNNGAVTLGDVTGFAVHA